MGIWRPGWGPRSFDPVRLGHQETRAWAAYYRHLYSYVYGVPAEAVRPAAQHRGAAMDLSDAWVAAGCDLDAPLLAQERRELIASYTALRRAVEHD